MHSWPPVRCLLLLSFMVLAVGGWSNAWAQKPGPTASDYGISSQSQLELSDADPQIWLSRLNDIELTIGDEDIPAETRGRALRDLNAISQGAKARLEQEQARLEPINKELKSLGPAPVEGEAESEDIANLRHEIGDRIATIEFRLREIRLILVRADNLELALISRTDSPMAGRLWERSPVLWEGETWRVAGANWALLIKAVAAAPGIWWDSTTGRGLSRPLIFAVGVGLIALVSGVLARRWLKRQLGRRKAEPDPSYARRIFAAFVTAISDALLPSFALGAIALAIWLLSKTDLLLPELAIAVCISGIIYFVLTGLSRAVLAPRAPAWRILPVSEDGAVILNRRVRIVAFYLAVVEVPFRSARHLGLLEFPEFETVTTLFLDGILAGLLLTLLPSHFWQTGEDEEPSRVVVGMSITLGALLIAIPVLDLIGFSALASYLLVVLVVTVVAVGFAVLLRIAGHEALAQVLRPAGTLRLRLYRWLRLGEGGARVLRVLGGLLVDLILFLALAYVLLRFYGLPNALLLHWVEKLADGIPIGNVLLSPVDIVMAVLVFAGVLLATGMLRRWLAEILRTGTRMDVGVRNAIVSGMGYGGVIVAIVVAIAIVGLDLSNLALVAGALSVGVGFGLRTVVENFVAGLLLLIERPIKEGDWIVTASHQGTVKRISVRSTEIETFDRASVIVPNAELVAQPVQNWTHKNRIARIVVPIGVAYGSDTEKVREILLGSAADHADVLKYPAPYVIFQRFGESSLDFELRCFVKDADYVLTCHSDLNFAIDKAFREAGIEIPFPQRDLHLRESLPLRVAMGEDHPAESESEGPAPEEGRRIPQELPGATAPDRKTGR